MTGIEMLAALAMTFIFLMFTIKTIFMQLDRDNKDQEND